MSEWMNIRIFSPLWSPHSPFYSESPLLSNNVFPLYQGMDTTLYARLRWQDRTDVDHKPLNMHRSLSRTKKTTPWSILRETTTLTPMIGHWAHPVRTQHPSCWQRRISSSSSSNKD